MVERVVGHSLETMYIYRDTADMGFLVDPGWGVVQEAWREGWGCFGSPPYRRRGWRRVAIDYGELARQIEFPFFVHFHAQSLRVWAGRSDNPASSESFPAR
jgi:hypothetical protein